MTVSAWADDSSSTWTDAAGTVWYKVSTSADFKTHVEADDNILLTADINLSELTPAKSDLLFNHEFKGKINGMYVPAAGDTIVSQLTNSSVVFFEKMTDATIQNVLISNCTFKGWDSGSGQIACEATRCFFTNVSMAQCSSVGDRDLYDCDKMGGVVGIATDCYFTNVKILNTTLQTDGAEAGLIAGVATGSSFDHCMTNLCSSIWANGNSYLGTEGNAYVGGLCGFAAQTRFTQCVNLALVGTEDDRTGGIVGYGEDVTMTGCANYGIIANNSLEGHLEVHRRIQASATVGISGIVSSGLVFAVDYMAYTYLLATSITLAVIEAVSFAVTAVALSVWVAYEIADSNYEPDELGGIAGCVKGSSTIARCSNYGPIDCYDAYCGGIVGYADGATIEASLNKAFVCAQEQAGGIVGYAESCTVRNNLNMGVVRTDATTRGMIVGDDDSHNTISGNYYLDHVADASGANKAVTQEQLASGEVTLALNQAITALDARQTDVFRQNLGKSIYPTLDTSAAKVTATTTNYNLWHQVKDLGEFANAITNLSAKIELQADIDLSGSPLFSLFTADHPFSGEIKGNGYSLMNLSRTVTENRYDDSDDVNAAYFAFAKNAKFQNLVIRNFHIKQADESNGDHPVEAFLVANSTNCTYTDIQIKESYIYVNEDRDALRYVGGVVGKSAGDTFTRCSLDTYSALQAYTGNSLHNAYLGGIAGQAINSTFSQCYNAAVLWADDNYVGGIVGYLEGGSIDRCLNTGGITAQERVGGIAGYVENAPVTRCVNTGWIADDDNQIEAYRAGIIGYLIGSHASVAYCINYGSVNYAGESSSHPISKGMWEDAIYGEGNRYYCQFNGKHTHDENTPEATYNKMLTGEFALNATDGDGNHWLYQSIDNQIDFPIDMPVPIAAAGTVYSNILCDDDHTQTYSNIYHGTEGHDSQAGLYGRCTICGNTVGDVATEIHISDAAGLTELARNVNSGIDLSQTYILLDNDIDMTGVNYTPIGKGLDTPFRGTFDGQGHRIKNLEAYSTQQCLGLFGCVSGSSAIRNLIVDSSCRFIGTGYGTAGIVGCVARANESLSNTINFTLECCGNEAAVSGDINAAGLVGGVYKTETNSDNVIISITDCYNTGNIAGNRESAALLGYGNGNLTVQRCYNTGAVTGCESGHSLIRYNTDKTWRDIMAVFNLSTVASDASATSATAEEFITGKVCAELNQTEYPCWGQQLSIDASPQIVNDGAISYSGTMANQWGTIVLPFDLTYKPADVNYRLYHLTGADGDNLSFTEYENENLIPAGTPMVIKAVGGKNAAGKYEINIPSEGNEISTSIAVQNNENDPSMPADWRMKGTYLGVTGMTGVYFIAQNKFWWAESPITIAPFRAWFVSNRPSSAARAGLRIEIADDAEGITAVRSEGGTLYMLNGKCLDLQGRQADVTRQGLQIRGGKVVWVK